MLFLGHQPVGDMGRTSEETWKDRCLRAEAQLKALTTDLHEQVVKDKEKDTKKLEIVVQKVHLDPSIGEHVASELCEHVTEAMIVGQFAKSKHDPRAYARSKKKDPDVAQQKWEMKQMFTMAFIVCLMQRMKSIHTYDSYHESDALLLCLLLACAEEILGDAHICQGFDGLQVDAPISAACCAF